LVFSENELTFTFAICYRRSVCRLSVTQSVEMLGNFFRPLVPWPSIDIHWKFYRDSPRWTPP